MPHRENYWIVHREAFAVWNMRFQFISESETIPKLIEFMTQFLRYVEDNQVLQLRSLNRAKDGASQTDYIEQVKQRISERRKFSFLGDITAVDENGEAYRTSPLYYYEAHEIKKAAVGNLTTLSKKLNPKTYDNFTTGAYTPIEISGSLNRDLDVFSPWISAYIRLHTDIWFPKVANLHRCWDEDFDHTVVATDNYELAALNTPMLNQFLQFACDLTLRFGGIWTFLPPDEDYGLQGYAPMVYETGIKLD